MTALVKYDAACRALAEAKAVDEVKDIRDKAEAMRVYARQAKNKDLEVDAAEIRIRAERRLGEMITVQKKGDGLHEGGRPRKTRSSEEQVSRQEPPTLAEVGIDRKLSMRAQKLAAVPEKEFNGMIGEWREKVEAENERVTTNLLKAGDKAQRRAAREAALAEKQQALPERRYGVILADPEWDFEVWSRDTGMDRHASNHYPTSAVNVIAARPVASIAADDCALFLWVPNWALEIGLMVMTAWGFKYKTNVCWAKPGLGTGYWVREAHELLLLGTRGKPPCPAEGDQHRSCFEGKRGKHSAKPSYQYDLIESYFPNLPKIELNCRGKPRTGWDGWGNEAEAADTGSEALPAKPEQTNGATRRGARSPTSLLTKEEARYRPAGDPSFEGRNCGTCRRYAGSLTCVRVEGNDIEAGYVCNHYAPRPHVNGGGSAEEGAGEQQTSQPEPDAAGTPEGASA